MDCSLFSCEKVYYRISSIYLWGADIWEGVDILYLKMNLTTILYLGGTKCGHKYSFLTNLYIQKKSLFGSWLPFDRPFSFASWHFYQFAIIVKIHLFPLNYTNSIILLQFGQYFFLYFPINNNKSHLIKQLSNTFIYGMITLFVIGVVFSIHTIT